MLRSLATLFIYDVMIEYDVNAVFVGVFYTIIVTTFYLQKGFIC